jgi:serine/threonine protein kinase
MADSRRIDWVGRLIEGRYRVLSLLGEGGMGATYLASDERQFQRRVALKVPHVEYLLIPDFRKRFDQEIRQLCEPDHPHIVKLFDSGEADGAPYAVMQYLPGGSLRDRLTASGGTLDVADVARWLPEVAEALDSLHSRQEVSVLHRDVKPENILFDAEGHAYLIDFSIAKVLFDPTFVTRTGHLPGTPPYMAPEAVAGKPLSPAYDQYALATVVFEALSGRLPYDPGADPLAALVQKVTVAPLPLRQVAPEIPAGVAEAVMKALSADPAHRFATCRDFAHGFARGLVPLSFASTLVLDKPREPLPTTPVRRPTGAVSVAVAVGVVVAVGTAISWSRLSWTAAGTPPVTPPGATAASPVADDSAGVEWERYQREMADSHAKLLDGEVALDVTPESKAGGWRDFLSQYSRDNPRSSDDERLRASARSRLDLWEIQLAPVQTPRVVTAQPEPPRRQPAAPESSPPAAPIPVAIEPPTVPPPAAPSQAPVDDDRRRTEAIRSIVADAVAAFGRADYESAARSYEAALAIDPAHEAAKEGLRRVQSAQAAETRVLGRVR